MKVILVCGARPNFMKVAPLTKVIAQFNASTLENSLQPILVHTGQHYDYEMSQAFFQDLELPQPDAYLGVGSGSHAEQTGYVMIEFEKVLFQENPDLVVVVGDVNSTLAGALAAAKLHIPVAHVEAGLRAPYRAAPEEINRRVTDITSRYLFTATSEDCRNLESEGVPQERIFFVGNIMVDSLLLNKEKAAQRETVSRLGLEKEGYAVLTLHRPYNVDERIVFLHLISAMNEISKSIPIIFPAHPRTKKQIEVFGLQHYFKKLSTVDCRLPAKDSGFYCIDPLGYLDFLNLEMNAKFVITDSGGIQHETTMLNVPCLTLDEVTCWGVTLTEGTNTLVGTKPERIIKEAFRILMGKGKKGSVPELWDGRTAQRIVDIISQAGK